MKTKSIILATIAGTIVLFGLGYLFYIVILGNFDLTIKSIAKIERDPIVFPAIILMEITYAFLISFIFNKWAGISTFYTGLKAGAFIGLLIGLSVGLEYYATTYLLSTKGVLLNALTFAIRFGIAGGVIAFILGMERVE
ncbi:MAG: hypothetical protein HKN68_16895 [Saprospiraceae bacterium]|nr:hypothetical protein [Saprospiraceae bacterium]